VFVATEVSSRTVIFFGSGVVVTGALETEIEIVFLAKGFAGVLCLKVILMELSLGEVWMEDCF